MGALVCYEHTARLRWTGKECKPLLRGMKGKLLRVDGCKYPQWGLATRSLTGTLAGKSQLIHRSTVLAFQLKPLKLHL